MVILKNKMSSFIISEDCMNRIINGLFWNHGFKNLYGSLLEKQGLNHEDDFKKFAITLWKLNQSAVKQRYPDDKSDYARIPKKFNWVDMKVNDYELLKALECLLYQCSEGDIPETELYKWLEDIINCLKSYIINKIPEYENAKWD